MILYLTAVQFRSIYVPSSLEGVSVRDGDQRLGKMWRLRVWGNVTQIRGSLVIGKDRALRPDRLLWQSCL